MVFQNGGSPPSWILRNLIFKPARTVQRVNVHHHASLWRSVKLLLRYGNVSIFQNGSHLPSWTLPKIKKSECVTVPNIITVYQNGGHPPSWIFYVHVWSTWDKYLRNIWSTIRQEVHDTESLYIKRGKASVHTYVRSSVTLDIASSVANDVTVRMTL